MTTLHRSSGVKGLESETFSFTKGAIDVLLDKSENILTAEGLRPLDKKTINTINDKMAAEGLRVIGVAMRRWPALPEELSPESIETELTFLGLAGLMDPPREEAKEAIRLCKTAGIIPVMITGDHPVTAAAIAKRLGIIESDEDVTITGPELAGLSQKEFEDKMKLLRS